MQTISDERTIIRQIERLGYHVMYRQGANYGTTIVSAVPLNSVADPKSVTFRGEPEQYRAICQLGKMVGLKLG